MEATEKKLRKQLIKKYVQITMVVIKLILLIFFCYQLYNQLIVEKVSGIVLFYIVMVISLNKFTFKIK